MKKCIFSWQFGSGSYIDVYKDKCECAHFNYDDKLRITVAWAGYLSQDDWERILSCVREAKSILKKVKKV